MQTTQSTKTIALSAFVAALITLCEPAFAGAAVAKATGILTTVITALTLLAVAAVTIAIMFVGFRMAFQTAQWKDVAPVFWGGILIGSAAALAALFLA